MDAREPPGTHPAVRPPALVVATVTVALEALALVVFGGWLAVESAVETADNAAVAQGSMAYFLVLGVLVGLVAVGLARRQTWSGGAAVFVQLLALPMAWYMASAGLLVGAVPLGVAALLAVWCLLGAATREALGR